MIQRFTAGSPVPQQSCDYELCALCANYLAWHYCTLVVMATKMGSWNARLFNQYLIFMSEVDKHVVRVLVFCV